MKLQVRWVAPNVFHAYIGLMRSDDPFKRAVGRAALKTQDEMRRHLDRMVYQQPPAKSGYIRTYTLWRSTHAASPTVDHGGDEEKARGGLDLYATDPNDVVGVRNGSIMSEVGSWISYSEFVHAGVNQPSPRPFVASSVQAAQRALDEEVKLAIVELSSKKLK